MIKWIGRYVGFMNLCLMYFVGALAYDGWVSFNSGNWFNMCMSVIGVIAGIVFLPIFIKERMESIKNGVEPIPSRRIYIYIMAILVTVSISLFILGWIE